MHEDSRTDAFSVAVSLFLTQLEHHLEHNCGNKVVDCPHAGCSFKVQHLNQVGQWAEWFYM